MEKSPILYIGKLISSILLFSLFFGCNLEKESSNQRDLIKKGYIKVVVIDLTGLDGCSFVLQQSDGSKLEPVGLNEEFKKSGMILYIKYKLIKNRMSICMSGTQVELSEVITIKK